MATESILDQIGKINQVLMTNDDRWEDRIAALKSLQGLVAKHGESGDLSSIDVFRLLDEPFKCQVRDLRSAIVRETCRTIEIFSETLRDGFRPLAWMLLPTLVEMSASGNKVITGCVHNTVKTVLSNSHVKNAVPIIAELLNSRNSHVREACFDCLFVILSNYETSRLDKHHRTVAEMIRVGVDDASGTARATARSCFPFYRAHWPDQADSMYGLLDPRTQKQLERESLLEAAILSESQTSHTSSSRRGSFSSSRVGDDDSLPSSPTREGTSPRNVSVGQRVVVHGRDPKRGTVRYAGPTKFATGMWVGVELDEARGRNDGSVEGEAYFTCRPMFGLFVKPAQVTVENRFGDSLRSTDTGPPIKARAAWDDSPRSTSLPVGFGEEITVDHDAESTEDGFVEDTPLETPEEASAFADELLAAHRIHLDDLLEGLRKEMMTMSKFEALATESRSPDSIAQYVGQIKEHREARLELSNHWAKQVSRIQSRLSLAPKSA